MKVLNIHLKNYDSQYCGKDLMSLEEVVLCMNGKYVPFSAKVFGIDRELQPHFSEDTVEARIELKEKVSIFDNPRWVTSKKNMELSQGLELISGKDYKVVGTIIDSDGDKLFKVVNSLGVLRSYHEGHFHKVIPEDLKPVVGIEEEDSFDNLVYVEPKSTNTSQYFSLKRSSCSEEQWNHVIKCLGNPLDCLGNDETIQWCCDDKIWFDDVGYPNDTVVFFNDLFHEVKQY